MVVVLLVVVVVVVILTCGFAFFSNIRTFNFQRSFRLLEVSFFWFVFSDMLCCIEGSDSVPVHVWFIAGFTCSPAWLRFRNWCRLCASLRFRCLSCKSMWRFCGPMHLVVTCTMPLKSLVNQIAFVKASQHWVCDVCLLTAEPYQNLARQVVMGMRCSRQALK